MKNIYLKTGQATDVFNELKTILDGTLTLENNEYNLALETNFAQGNIKGITFPDSMVYMQLDVTFFDDAMLSMESLRTSPIFFAYCAEGNFKHSIGLMGDKKTLEKNQTGILKSSAKVNNILYFERNTPIKLFIIGIGTNKSTNDESAALIKKLKYTFFSGKEDYLHIRAQNSKINDKINELNAVSQRGIVRNLLKKHILEMILEMEIKQHSDSFTEMSQLIYSSAVKGIDEVKRTSELVMDFSTQLFTTDILMQKAALLTNKFQEELKLISSRRIQNFLVFMRIERQRI